MPTWNVECTDARSVTGKPESTICTSGAEAFEFLDNSLVLMSLMSLRVERLTFSVERLLRCVCLGQCLEAFVIPEEWNHLPVVINLHVSNLALKWSQRSPMSTVSLAGNECAFNCHLLTLGPSGSESTNRNRAAVSLAEGEHQLARGPARRRGLDSGLLFWRRA